MRSYGNQCAVITHESFNFFSVDLLILLDGSGEDEQCPAVKEGDKERN